MQHTRKTLLVAAVIIPILLSACAGTGRGRAITTYREPSQRFVIDLPQGHRLVSQVHDRYLFRGQGPEIGLYFLPGKHGAEKAYEVMKKQFLGHLNNAALQGTVNKTELKGNPAVFGKYKGTVRYEMKRAADPYMDEFRGSRRKEPPFELTQVDRYAVVGAVVLKGGSLGLGAFYSSGQREIWEKTLQDLFFSIGDGGAPVTGPKQ